MEGMETRSGGRGGEGRGGERSGKERRRKTKEKERVKKDEMEGMKHANGYSLRALMAVGIFSSVRS